MPRKSKKPKTVDSTEFNIELFRKARAFIDCHLNDYNESWYDDVGETDYRVPDRLPLIKGTRALVHVNYTTLSGDNFDGFMNYEAGLKITRVPVLEYTPTFWNGFKFCHFWNGAIHLFGRESLEEHKSSLLTMFPDKKKLFPITARVDKAIVGRALKFPIDGFGYFSDANDTIVIEQ